jgi:transcriptional regulator with XRE-family HTH domain
MSHTECNNWFMSISSSVNTSEYARTRRVLGLSQDEVAQAVGLSQTALSRLERGFKTPSPATQKRLEEFLAYEEAKR